jgi:hypothetical protein
MSLKLRDPSKLPSGGFLFHEAERTFGEMVSFGGKVQLILVFRQDNNRARATKGEVAEDLENYTCNRFPASCYDPGNIEATASTYGYGRVVKGCPSCGGQPA